MQIHTHSLSFVSHTISLSNSGHRTDRQCQTTTQAVCRDRSELRFDGSGGNLRRRRHARTGKRTISWCRWGGAHADWVPPGPRTRLDAIGQGLALRAGPRATGAALTFLAFLAFEAVPLSVPVIKGKKGRRLVSSRLVLLLTRLSAHSQALQRAKRLSECNHSCTTLPLLPQRLWVLESSFTYNYTSTVLTALRRRSECALGHLHQHHPICPVARVYST